MLSVEQQLAILKRGTVEIYQEQELVKKLEESVRAKRPLVIKAGFDPTAPDLHLGHTVLLRKLRQFQDCGHQVIFLIGDFTGRIGDPTGRSLIRKQLTPDEVHAFAQTYKNQVAKVLDMQKLQVVFNSQWFEKMALSDFLGLTGHSTVSQMLARADFKKRYTGGEDISLLEFMYPILQGYDSVELKADVELGGTDQIFNLLFGRELQTDFGIAPQVVITMPLLEGTDGVQKMSKSYGNYIGISEPAASMFGKVMSIPDELMYKYYELLTDEDLALVKGMHPRDAKVSLAKRIVSDYHGPQAADHEADEFTRVFSQKETPADIEVFSLHGTTPMLLDLLIEAKLAPTKNEARRLLSQGAVSFNDEKLSDERTCVTTEGVLKVGKRRFLKITL